MESRLKARMPGIFAHLFIKADYAAVIGKTTLSFLQEGKRLVHTLPATCDQNWRQMSLKPVLLTAISPAKSHKDTTCLLLIRNTTLYSQTFLRQAPDITKQQA
ncbi:hypothetical protein I79_025932 [Cricetulus griseus]|uniref:Uncharacterized protein n=1 Tax=Cricetulus griseus TaxID=10029 RepID=G3IPL6_CRIGR|nr:hypothetical protein I79_025932 [Cricetulus griseus]